MEFGTAAIKLHRTFVGTYVSLVVKLMMTGSELVGVARVGMKMG